MSETRIKLDEYGVGSIVVDGVDLSMMVSPEFTVTGSTGSPATVTLNFIGLNLALDAEADVVAKIPEDVAKALEALGWKRP